MSDLTPENIRVALARAAVTARPFQYHDQIGSTNDAAAAWLEAVPPPPPGAFVVADDQIGGRGRLGRVWQTSPGTALTVTFVLYPTLAALPRLPLLGALAVVEALDTFGIAAGIKWPNDVLVDGRKVSGVLPEAVWQGDRLRGAVIGIGVNVRVDFGATPLAHTAGSLTPLTGIVIHRADLLAQIAAGVDRWHPLLAGTALFTAWRDRLTMLGQAVRASSISGLGDRTIVEGIAIDVRADGALLLRRPDGDIQTIIAGDIMPLERK